MIWDQVIKIRARISNRIEQRFRFCEKILPVDDLIFQLSACVSDPKAARDLVFGPDGILKYINEKKSYVDMSTVDALTTTGIDKMIFVRNFSYL
jgi:hypothetical protein